MTRSFTLLVEKPFSLFRARGHGNRIRTISLGYFEWQLMSLEEKERAVWISIDNAYSQPVARSHELAGCVPTQVIAYAGYDAIGSKS